MLRVGAILLVLAAVAAVTNAEGYDGFKIFEVLPKTQEQTDFLHELSQMGEYYDFFVLRPWPNHPATVMVDSYELENFLDALAQHNFSYIILNNNVGRTVKEEIQLNKLIRSPTNFTGKGRLSTDRFYSHAEINNYIEDLAERFPSRVIVKTVGKSYEGRNIKTILISNGDGRADKKVIFVDGTFHAREWISPAAVLYVIEQLVENFHENAELLLDYNFWILPVVNPDGYEYSQTENRFWRKTRQIFKINEKTCYGTDPNRNFDFHWNQGGASSNPCDFIYAGPHAFSEPETIVMRDIIHSLKQRGIMYLTVHSYGNCVLYPWGWTSDLPDDWEELHEVAKAGADAIFDATGSIYRIGSSTNVLYLASGGSDDYAYYSGFKISFTMELPGGGLYGFDPPATSIDSMVKETWVGIRAMFKQVIKKYSYTEQHIEFL